MKKKHLIYTYGNAHFETLHTCTTSVCINLKFGRGAGSERDVHSFHAEIKKLLRRFSVSPVQTLNGANSYILLYVNKLCTIIQRYDTENSILYVLRTYYVLIVFIFSKLCFSFFENARQDIESVSHFHSHVTRAQCR